MENIIQAEKISTKDMLKNILSNVFYILDVETYMQTTEKRRLLFSGNSLVLDIRDNQNDSIDVRYLKREGNILAKNTKQQIDFRIIDKWLVVCVLLVISITFITISMPYIPYTEFLIPIPLVAFFIKCLKIEFATKEYNSITKYIKKDVHQSHNIVWRKPKVIQIIYQPVTFILSKNTISNYGYEEVASYEEVMQLENPVSNSVEDLALSEKEKEILFSCVNFLDGGNIIEIIDKNIQKEYSNYTKREIYPLTQIKLTKLLVTLLNKKRIRVRITINQLDFVRNITDNMKLKDNSPLNFDSFKTEFNRQLKAEKISWTTLNSHN